VMTVLTTEVWWWLQEFKEKQNPREQHHWP